MGVPPPANRMAPYGGWSSINPAMHKMCVSVDLLIIFGSIQVPVVRRVDNFIQRINPHPADKVGAFLILIVIYPLDKDIHSSYNRSQARNR